MRTLVLVSFSTMKKIESLKILSRITVAHNFIKEKGERSKSKTENPLSFIFLDKICDTLLINRRNSNEKDSIWFSCCVFCSIC